MSDVINICIPGNADPYDSYGLIALELARHLTRQGVYVNLFAMGKREMDSQDEETRAIANQPIRPALGSIMLGYPTGYSNHVNPLVHMGPRICISMFESSKILHSWIEPLNDMNAVITPSTFCADVFRRCGVTAPIHVVPLGTSETFKYAERPPDRVVTFYWDREPAGELHHRPLTFLAFLDRGQRKGGIVALQAFLRAFGEDMNYRLILKGRKPRAPLRFTNPNIEVIQRDMSEQELYELYLECDVLINQHKGEGFGLLPREFARTGGISLTTNWSGTTDGLGQWGWPLGYSLEPALWVGNKPLEGQDLGEWAACDPDSVAQRLLQVARNVDTFRLMARYHAANVERMYSWRKFAEQVLEIWEGVAHGNHSGASEIAHGLRVRA